MVFSCKLMSVEYMKGCKQTGTKVWWISGFQRKLLMKWSIESRSCWKLKGLLRSFVTFVQDKHIYQSYLHIQTYRWVSGNGPLPCKIFLRKHEDIFAFSVIFRLKRWCILIDDKDLLDTCNTMAADVLDTPAYVDYMDLAVRCSRKAVKLNHSLTHSWIHKQPRHQQPMYWPGLPRIFWPQHQGPISI